MNRFPEIFETMYGDPINEEFTRRDAALNSRLLETICHDLLKVEYKENGFCTGLRWRLRITDKHDVEKQPHFILDVGELGKLEAEPSAKVTMRYIDNYSAGGSRIEQTYGSVQVMAYGSFGVFTPKYVAQNIAFVYAKALRELFPDYYIHVDQSAFEL